MKKMTISQAKALVMVVTKEVSVKLNETDTTKNRTDVANKLKEALKNVYGKAVSTRYGTVKLVDGKLMIADITDPKVLTGFANTNWTGRIKIIKEMAKNNLTIDNVFFPKDKETKSFVFDNDKKVREAWAIIVRDALGTGKKTTSYGDIFVSKSTGLITLAKNKGNGVITYVRFGKIEWADRVKIIKEAFAK